MAEYIEREALLEKAEEIEWWNETTGFYDHIRIVHAYDVEDAPTADVVEVVRCKDCKYFLHDTDYCKKHNAGYCEFDNQIRARLHFCGLAIKKEGAEE